MDKGIEFATDSDILISISDILYLKHLLKELKT